MSIHSADESDVVVIGGGLVGHAIALGLARFGTAVTILDEGDIAFRASRGNFALIWVTGKGLGMPEYAAWSRQSALDWGRLAAMLQAETGIDVRHNRTGGFVLFLSQAELDRRLDLMRRVHNSESFSTVQYELLDHSETRRRLPDLGRDVVGSLYSPFDGDVNSLKLFRALREASARHGVDYRPNCPVETIVPRNSEFAVSGAFGEVRAEKVVLCAGLGNPRLAPMVGLDAPVRPSKGQIIVTEKTEPFLHSPIHMLRQTDEAGVMIGDSQEDRGFDTVVGQPILSTMAERAVKMFPRLAGLNVVRTWSALRVMSPDGFPIYDQSQTHPGAFLATCHSGVTLAANHALTLAPAILAGELPDTVARFTARRFHVPAYS